MGTASRPIRFPVTIASGATTSNIVTGWDIYGSSAGMWIFSPSGLAETVNMQVAHKDNATSTDDWYPYFDGGPPSVQQTTPLAGNAQPYVLLVCVAAIKLVATTTVAADRVFYITFAATN
jgi:hypothetical protein